MNCKKFVFSGNLAILLALIAGGWAVLAFLNKNKPVAYVFFAVACFEIVNVVFLRLLYKK